MTSLNRCTARMGVALIALALLGGCATESHQALEVTKPATAASAASYAGTRAALAVGNFDNRSTYMRGIFSDGVDFMIQGDVVEFGRKETGDQQLFGILGSGKKQTAYSKVTLNVVDVLTSQVVYSASGAGEYALSDREVIGFGGASGYDSTLNGKVLDLAIREPLDHLVAGAEQGSWRPAKASQ